MKKRKAYKLTMPTQSTPHDTAEKPKEDVIQIKLRPDGHTDNIVSAQPGHIHDFHQVEAMKCECDCGLGMFGTATEINKRIKKGLTNDQ